MEAGAACQEPVAQRSSLGNSGLGVVPLGPGLTVRGRKNFLSLDSLRILCLYFHFYTQGVADGKWLSVTKRRHSKEIKAVDSGAGSNSSAVTEELCGIGQVAIPLCSSVPHF